MNEFFLKEDPKLFETEFKENRTECMWLISADKIFPDEFTILTDKSEKVPCSQIYHLEFMIYKAFLYDQTKTAESSVYAREVHIYMPSGIHCAMLESRMAKATIIPKITIFKSCTINGTLNALEKKEFNNCVINAFGIKDDLIGFAFRYTSLKDFYIQYKSNGTKEGSATTDIDLVKWEIKSK